MALVRAAYRVSFLNLRSNIQSTATGIRTTLAPEAGKKLDLSHVHEEAGDHHGDHGGHETPPAPLSLKAKAVFSPNSFVSTKLFPTLRIAETRRYYTTTTAAPEKAKVAVILSGSGVHDGSEIHESVSILIHLSRAGVDAKCFAPDKAQADVINHIKGTATVDETRNVLVESARIARGKVKPLSQLKADEYAAIIFPGGYGAAKNLSTFAKDGENCSVDPDVSRVLKEFHGAKKPIGLICVSPVIAAKVIPNVSVTLGNDDKDIIQVIERMGAKPQPAGITDVVVDEVNNVVSTPAYMCNTSVHKVFDGVGKLVETVLSIAKKGEKPTTQ